MVTLAEMLAAEFGSDFENIVDSLPKSTTQPPYAKRAPTDIAAIVLHHTEAPRATTWQAVATYHVRSNDWPGIAYHLGLRTSGDGCIVSLLNYPETRSYHAHAWGNNYGIAICVAGRFDTDKPTPSEIDRIERAVAVIREWATWAPQIDVMAHGDVPGNETSCPGQNLIALIPSLNAPPPDDGSLSGAIWSAAKAGQTVRPNKDSAIERLMREQGYGPIGNETDVVVDGEWAGVAQLGYHPEGSAEGVAFFATNNTADGQWEVGIVEQPG